MGGIGGDMKEFAVALAKVQQTIKGAKKDSVNPHFKSKYADLESVWEACREVLPENGFSVLQFGALVEGQWALATKLHHVCGFSEIGYTPLLNSKGDMQGLGSAWSYARRYGLAAMVGVCPEDDDGNAATAKPEAKTVPAKAPDGYAEWLIDFKATADEGSAALAAAFRETPQAFRDYFVATESEASRQALKVRAATVMHEATHGVPA